MNLTNLVMQVRAMKGLMPEANRTLIAARLATMLTKHIEETHGKTSAELEAWTDRGAPRFLRECRLTVLKVPDKPLVETSVVDLQGFIKRWQMIDGWRRDENEDWQNFTEEQNLIRHTMLRELRLLLDGHTLPEIPDRHKHE